MMWTATAAHINVTCLLLLIYSFIRTSSTEFSVWGRTFHVFSFFAIWTWSIQCSYNDCSWWYRCLCQRDHLIRMFAFKLCSWMACHGPHIVERDRKWEKKKTRAKRSTQDQASVPFLLCFSFRYLPSAQYRSFFGWCLFFFCSFIYAFCVEFLLYFSIAPKRIKTS